MTRVAAALPTPSGTTAHSSSCDVPLMRTLAFSHVLDAVCAAAHAQPTVFPLPRLPLESTNAEQLSRVLPGDMLKAGDMSKAATNDEGAMSCTHKEPRRQHRRKAGGRGLLFDCCNVLFDGCNSFIHARVALHAMVGRRPPLPRPRPTCVSCSADHYMFAPCFFFGKILCI